DRHAAVLPTTFSGAPQALLEDATGSAGGASALDTRPLRASHPRLVVIDSFDETTRIATILVCSSLSVDEDDVRVHRYVAAGTAVRKRYQPSERVAVENLASKNNYINFAFFVRVRCHFCGTPNYTALSLAPPQTPTREVQNNARVTDAGWETICRLHAAFWKGIRYNADGSPMTPPDLGGSTTGNVLKLTSTDLGKSSLAYAPWGTAEQYGDEELTEARPFLHSEWGEGFLAPARPCIPGWEAGEEDISDDESDDDIIDMVCWTVEAAVEEHQALEEWDESEFASWKSVNPLSA
ncbi:MAG: hypothetical protein BJ554DRAFT_3152, partial [Olpidium bornovanus]